MINITRRVRRHLIRPKARPGCLTLSITAIYVRDKDQNFSCVLGVRRAKFQSELFRSASSFNHKTLSGRQLPNTIASRSREPIGAFLLLPKSSAVIVENDYPNWRDRSKRASRCNFETRRIHVDLEKGDTILGSTGTTPLSQPHDSYFELAHILLDVRCCIPYWRTNKIAELRKVVPRPRSRPFRINDSQRHSSLQSF